MQTSEPQTLIVGEGAAARAIRYRVSFGSAPAAPGIFWLPGFMSDMSSTKATALATWAAEKGLGTTFFDYSGHGQSDGAFTDGTIGRWLEETHAVFTQVTRGPQIVVGSSMGGYLALLLARKLRLANAADAKRCKALVLIAPAWNMTEDLMWARFPDDVRRKLIEDGRYDRPSNYGAPYPITYRLIEEGRAHLITRAAFDPGCPVTILQGALDPDVPIAHVRQLVGNLPLKTTTLIEIPDGDHRLSRDQDIALLFAEIAKQI